MAERRGSRRNTPQPVANATSNVEPSGIARRSTRATRSQSRELSESERQDGVKTQKNPRQTSSIEERANLKKGRLAKPLSEQQDLSTVIEDPSIAYPELPIESDGGARGTPRSTRRTSAKDKTNAASPGGASAFSGTTVRASRTAQELEDLVSEGLLDALPDLSSASDKLLNFLIPKNLSEATVDDLRRQLNLKNSRQHKNFQRLSKALYVQLEPFGSDSLIDLRRAVSSLIASKDLATSSAEPWRPDVLIQKANLAALTARALTCSDPSEAEPLWEELENNFLRYFVINQDDAQSPQIFQLALEIRTQYTITQLLPHTDQAEFDLGEILARVFGGQGESLKGWDFDGMGFDELPTACRQSLVLRVGKIREICQQAVQSSTASSELPTSLRSSFPWETSSYILMAWAKEQSQGIEATIDKIGGVENIIRSLSDELQRRKGKGSFTFEENDPQAESDQVRLNYDTPSESSNSTSAKAVNLNAKTRIEEIKHNAFRIHSPKHVNMAAHLAAEQKRQAARRGVVKAMEEDEPQAQQKPPEAQVARTTVADTHATSPRRDVQGPQHASTFANPDSALSTGQNDDWQQQDGGDEEDAFQVDDRHIEQVLTLSAQQQAESNKENEVRPVSSGSKRRRLIDPQPHARRISPISQSIDEDDQQDASSDISQGEEFQQSRMPTSTSSSRIKRRLSKHRVAYPSTGQPSPAKRARIQVQPQNRRLQDSEPRVLQEQQIPLSQAQMYSNVNRVAKDRIADRAKGPQSRRPWSEIEIETLLDLIKAHGISYARIKREDSVVQSILVDRDQVALKDKARNMKMDYLKGGTFLPRNFEKIPLSRSLIERLTAAGIDYDPETGHRRDGHWNEGQRSDDED